MLSVRDMGRWSKNAEDFFLTAGDAGMRARVSIVRSERDGLGRMVRIGVVSTVEASSARLGVASSYELGASSGKGGSVRDSEGRLVRVKRLLKRNWSVSAVSASACSWIAVSVSSTGSISPITTFSAMELVRRLGVEGTRECLAIDTGGWALGLAAGVLATPEFNCSREAEFRKRELRPSPPLLTLERNWDCEAEERSCD